MWFLLNNSSKSRERRSLGFQLVRYFLSCCSFTVFYCLLDNLQFKFILNSLAHLFRPVVPKRFLHQDSPRTPPPPHTHIKTFKIATSPGGQRVGPPHFGNHRFKLLVLAPLFQSCGSSRCYIIKDNNVQYYWQHNTVPNVTPVRSQTLMLSKYTVIKSFNVFCRHFDTVCHPTFFF